MFDDINFRLQMESALIANMAELNVMYKAIQCQLDYRCGSVESWSDVKTLKVLDTSEMSNPTFAVYGDLGWENARSIPYLIKDAEEGRIDGVLHSGDLAYDLYEVSTSCNAA